MNAAALMLRVCVCALLLGTAGACASALDGEPLQQRFTPCVPAGPDGAEAILRAADQMLYEAKHRGRNCVVATDDD